MNQPVIAGWRRAVKDGYYLVDGLCLATFAESKLTC